MISKVIEGHFYAQIFLLHSFFNDFGLYDRILFLLKILSNQINANIMKYKNFSKMKNNLLSHYFVK